MLLQLRQDRALCPMEEKNSAVKDSPAILKQGIIERRGMERLLSLSEDAHRRHQTLTVLPTVYTLHVSKQPNRFIPKLTSGFSFARSVIVHSRVSVFVKS